MTRSKSTDIFLRIPDLDYTETPPEIDAEEFLKTVTSRRSVRVFDGSAIPTVVVEHCLDLALLSPNSSNLQPWEFHWVRSRDKKAELVRLCLSQPAARTAAELIICVARTRTWKTNRLKMLETFARSDQKVPESAKAYYKRLVPLVYSQGFFSLWGYLKKVFFAVRGLFTPTPREPTSHADMRVWAVKSTALACQTLMLSFRAYGYDTCPIEGFDSAKLRRLLKLPRDAEIVMVIAAGKRAGNGVYGPRIRFERELFVKEI